MYARGLAPKRLVNSPDPDIRRLCASLFSLYWFCCSLLLVLLFLSLSLSLSLVIPFLRRPPALFLLLLSLLLVFEHFSSLRKWLSDPEPSTSDSMWSGTQHEWVASGWEEDFVSDPKA